MFEGVLVLELTELWSFCFISSSLCELADLRFASQYSMPVHANDAMPVDAAVNKFVVVNITAPN